MWYLWECNVSDDRAISEEIVCLKEYIEEHYSITDEITISYDGVYVMRNSEAIGTIEKVQKI